jgi:heme A synthase
LNKFTKENPILEKKLKIKNADILTNNRKSYYEDQQIDTLYYYHKIFLYIYIFIIIAFLICMIFKSSDFSRGKQIAIFVFLILYIFIAVPVFHFFLRICKNIFELLPANVYKTL